MRANRATTLLARSLLNRIKEWSEFRIRLTLAFPRASRRRRHACWEAGNNRESCLRLGSQTRARSALGDRETLSRPSRCGGSTTFEFVPATGAALDGNCTSIAHDLHSSSRRQRTRVVGQGHPTVRRSGTMLKWARGNVAYWPFASFRVGAAVRSLLERSGHQLEGKIGRFGRE